MILVLLCSLRDNTIRDTSVYVDIFNGVEERSEPGFLFLVDILKKISSNPHFIFGVIALISVGLKFKFIKSYAPYFWPTILIYVTSSFIYGDFVAIRAALVTSLVLWSIRLALDKRIIPFLLIIALATSFHVTAVVCLFVWPIVNWDINLKGYFWLIPIAYVIYFSGRGFGYLASYIQIPYVQSLYALYSGETGSELGVVNVFSVTQLVRCFICMYVIWANRNRELNRIYDVFLKMYCFGIGLYVILTDVPAFSARLSELFAITGILVIGNLFYYLPQTKGPKIRLIIIGMAYLNLISVYLNVLR